MTSSVSGIGSLHVGAVQVVGSPGAAVRVMARLYDPDSVLIVSTGVEKVLLDVFDRAAADVPLVTLPSIVPSSVIVALAVPAAWTKDTTGRNFDHLLPSNVALLLKTGHTYVLRYTLDTPRETPSASGTDYGDLRYEVGLAV